MHNTILLADDDVELSDLLKEYFESEGFQVRVAYDGEAALNARQHSLLRDGHEALLESKNSSDPLLIAECLRRARLAFDRLIGRATTEDMLDTLFGRFCIGK